MKWKRKCIVGRKAHVSQSQNSKVCHRDFSDWGKMRKDQLSVEIFAKEWTALYNSITQFLIQVENKAPGLLFISFVRQESDMESSQPHFHHAPMITFHKLWLSNRDLFNYLYLYDRRRSVCNEISECSFCRSASITRSVICGWLIGDLRWKFSRHSIRLHFIRCPSFCSPSSSIRSHMRRHSFIQPIDCSELTMGSVWQSWGNRIGKQFDLEWIIAPSLSGPRIELCMHLCALAFAFQNVRYVITEFISVNCFIMFVENENANVKHCLFP